MDAILLKLADLGTVGALAAVLLYDVFYLQRKLMQIIENNTAAMTILKEHCQKNK